MLNETQVNKVRQFANDTVMKDVVLGVIGGVFARKSKDRDVQNLASRFLCLELLEEARAEIEKYKSGNETENKPAQNIAV